MLRLRVTGNELVSNLRQSASGFIEETRVDDFRGFRGLRLSSSNDSEKYELKLTSLTSPKYLLTHQSFKSLTFSPNFSGEIATTNGYRDYSESKFLLEVLKLSVLRNSELPHTTQGQVSVLFVHLLNDCYSYISCVADIYTGELQRINAIECEGGKDAISRIAKQCDAHAIIVSNTDLQRCDRIMVSLNEWLKFSEACLPQIPSQHRDHLLAESRKIAVLASASSQFVSRLRECIECADPSVREVATTAEICLRFGMFPQLFSLSRRTGLSCDQLCATTITRAAEIAVLMSCISNKFLLDPLKGSLLAAQSTTVVGGGKQLEVKRATDTVHVLDFFMLYPSVVVAYNLGVGSSFVVRKCDIKELETHTGNNLRESCFVWKRKYFEYFCSFREPPGPLALFLKDLIDTRRRSQCTGERNATKLVANACIGLLSTPRCEYLGGKAVADMVTFLGREILSKLEKACISRGLLVVAGDTDSVFVQGLKTAEVSKMTSELSDESTFPVSQYFQLKLENTFKMFAATKKKRYVGFTGYDLLDNVVVRGVQRLMCSQFKGNFAQFLQKLRDDVNDATQFVYTQSFTDNREEFAAYEKESGKMTVKLCDGKLYDVNSISTEKCSLPVSADYIVCEGNRGHVVTDVLKYTLHEEEAKRCLTQIIKNVKGMQVQHMSPLKDIHVKLEHVWFDCAQSTYCVCIDSSHETPIISAMLQTKEWEKCSHNKMRPFAVKLYSFPQNVYIAPPISHQSCYIASNDQDDISSFICAIHKWKLESEVFKSSVLLLLKSSHVTAHTPFGAFVFSCNQFRGLIDVK